MSWDLSSHDRVVNSFKQVLDVCVQEFGIEIMSIVLYGSRARGDRNSGNDYEFLLLLKQNTPLQDYIHFNEKLKIELIREKLLQVKFTIYTPEIFEHLMVHDTMVGTILYIICKENIILFDRMGTFAAIKERIVRNEMKDEEEFLNQCIEFAKMMGSEKWQRKWEKTLLQYKYTRRRRSV
ncbi:MAG: nucleotidyltransferase domain-containing protein [Clostridia bacterium]|nr:nucleotidyltransferase domain-containing protein [Clostridia bacterium]